MGRARPGSELVVEEADAAGVRGRGAQPSRAQSALGQRPRRRGWAAQSTAAKGFPERRRYVAGRAALCTTRPLRRQSACCWKTPRLPVRPSATPMPRRGGARPDAKPAIGDGSWPISRATNGRHEPSFYAVARAHASPVVFLPIDIDRIELPRCLPVGQRSWGRIRPRGRLAATGAAWFGSAFCTARTSYWRISRAKPVVERIAPHRSVRPEP